MAQNTTSKTTKPRVITCTLTAKGNKAIVTVPPEISKFKGGDILHFRCDQKHRVHVLLKQKMFAQVQVKEGATEPAHSSIEASLEGDTFVVRLMLPQDDGGPDTGGDG